MGGIAGVAAIGAVATVAGSAISSSNAADAQEKSTNAAIAANQAQQATTRGDLLPYQTAGTGALNQLTSLTSGDPATVQTALEQTPGYQFTLTQGLKATQNSAAARGLGVSGAALKGAATYATGLADSTYQNQYNRLMGIANLGENAAAQTGALGQQSTSNVSNALIGGGNAQAAADTAIGGSVGTAANTVTNAYLVNSLIKGNTGNGLFGSTTPANSAGNFATTG